MREQITITQSLTTVDLFKASVLFALGHKRLRTIFYLIPSIIIIISIVPILLSNKEDRWFEILNMVGILGLLVVFFSVMFFILSFLMIRIKPNLFKNINYTFYNRGMTKSGNNLEHTQPWDKFVKWKETNSSILLFIAENDAHIVLKKSITAEELSVIKSIIESHLGLFPSKK